MSTNPKQTESLIVRLTPEVYTVLETKLSKLIVTEATTPIQVGYQLGVQAVLKELRAGYVIQVH